MPFAVPFVWYLTLKCWRGWIFVNIIFTFTVSLYWIYLDYQFQGICTYLVLYICFQSDLCIFGMKWVDGLYNYDNLINHGLFVPKYKMFLLQFQNLPICCPLIIYKLTILIMQTVSSCLSPSTTFWPVLIYIFYLSFNRK